MTAIRKEIMDYIDDIPDSKLEALMPILTLLAEDVVVVETNLTNEEKDIIRQGREEYKKVGFVPLNLNWFRLKLKKAGRSIMGGPLLFA